MSNSGSGALVAKLWNFCNILKDDGVSYGDYVQQLTNLLFLKMAHERVATWTEGAPGGRWRSYSVDKLLARDKASLDVFWLRDESLEDSATRPHVRVVDRGSTKQTRKNTIRAQRTSPGYLPNAAGKRCVNLRDASPSRITSGTSRA